MAGRPPRSARGGRGGHNSGARGGPNSGARGGSGSGGRGGSGPGGRGGFTSRGAPTNQSGMTLSQLGIPSCEDSTQDNGPNSAEVTNMENKVIKMPFKVDPNHLLDNRKNPLLPARRPCFGEGGEKPVNIWTNHVWIDIPKDLKIHEYSISIKNKKGGEPGQSAQQTDQEEDEAIKGRLRKEIIRKLLQRFRDLAGQRAQRNKFVTDFSGVLLVAEHLATFDEGPGRTRQTTEDTISFKGRNYCVTVKFTRTIYMSNLFDYLGTLGDFDLNQKAETLQMLNIWLRHSSKADPNLVVFGSKTYPITGRPIWAEHDIQGGLIAMRGIFASIRPATGRILANIQVAHSAFFRPDMLETLIRPFLHDLPRVNRLIYLLKVEATHLKPREKKYDAPPSAKSKQGSSADHTAGDDKRYKTIFGLVKRQDGTLGVYPHEQMFHNSKLGTDETVRDYFWRVYSIELKKDLPLVNVSNDQKKPIYMPVDVLKIKEGQFARLTLNETQMRNMLDFASQRPVSNYNIVRQGADLIHHGRDANGYLFPDFGRVGNLIQVQARFLPPAALQYAKTLPELPRNSPPSWNLQVRNSNAVFLMNSPARLKKCALLFVGDMRGDMSAWRTTCQSLWTALKSYGALDGSAALPPPVTWSPRNPKPSLEHILKTFIDNRYQHVLAVMFDDSASAFENLKYHGDILCGISTTCMRSSKLMKDSQQYFGNVALKVNLKGRGVNQKLVPPALTTTGRMGKLDLNPRAPGKFQKEALFSTPFNGEPTMIVGMDVTHRSPEQAKDVPSVAGVVASIDEALGQWPGELTVQTSGEMVAALGSMFERCLGRWKAKHGTYPQNILIYRDGVSEGEYQRVLRHEYPQVLESCRKLYKVESPPPPKPRITIVVAGKRHNVRFYASAPHVYARDQNTKAGLVVDRGITEVRNWDFYLQPHAAIQGTVKPVHYFVVLDEIFKYHHDQGHYARARSNAADQLEFVTHQLSYIFGRATLPVGGCTPVAYAHLACKRARDYLKYLRQDNPLGEVDANTIRSMQAGVTIHPLIRDTMFYI